MLDFDSGIGGRDALGRGCGQFAPGRFGDRALRRGSGARDANGNLKTSVTLNGSTYVTTNFKYDSESRLVAASGGKTLNRAYDPLGRLWETSGGPAGTRRLEYDGDRLITEFDGADAKVRGYVHGPGTDEPLVQYDMSGATVA